MTTRFQSRSVHVAGNALAFDKDGKHVVTSGDGTVILHDAADRANPDGIHLKTLRHPDHGRGLAGTTPLVTHLDVWKQRLVTCDDVGTVRLYSYPELEFECQVYKMTLPARMVAIHPRGDWVAIVGDSTKIAIVNLHDTTKIVTLEGHNGAVRGIAWEPRGDFLVSTSIDGTIRIWDTLILPTVHVKHTISGVLGGNMSVDAKNAIAITWANDSSCFAVPGKQNGTITVIENESWDTLYTLQGNVHRQPVDLLRFAPQNDYIISSSVGDDNFVAVWDKRSKTCVAKMKTRAHVVGLATSPDGKDVAWMDASGDLNYWTQAIPKKTQKKETNLENLFDEKEVEKEEDEDDWLEDDDGAGYAEYGYTPPGKKKGRLGLDMDDFEKKWTVKGMMATTAPVNLHTPQQPFQPGSTPIKAGASTRYLAFTTTGVIYSIDQGVNTTVHVEFHDAAGPLKSFQLSDPYGYSMAVLGERGAAFASESTSGHPSTLYYKPFHSWATKSDWMMQMGALENIKAVAITGKGIVVVTDQRLMRCFSYGGFQTHIMTLPHNVVSIVGSEDQLLVTYHAGNMIGEDQCLGYQIFNVEDWSRVGQDFLPISPSSTLEWIGFAENGLPATYDSLGVLRVLLPNQTWTPILDSRLVKQGKQEHYWPVGITDKSLLCVVIKGGQTYPTYPYKIISDVDLKVPVLHLEGMNGEIEEQLFRSRVWNSGKVEEDVKKQTEMDGLLIKLIQAACKTERLARALDLTNMLELLPMVDVARQVAMHMGLANLAERISLVKESKMLQQRERDASPVRVWKPMEKSQESMDFEESLPLAQTPQSLPLAQTETRTETSWVNSIGFEDDYQSTSQESFEAPRQKLNPFKPNPFKQTTDNVPRVASKMTNPFAIKKVNPVEKPDSLEQVLETTEKKKRKTKDDAPVVKKRKGVKDGTLDGVFKKVDKPIERTERAESEDVVEVVNKDDNEDWLDFDEPKTAVDV